MLNLDYILLISRNLWIPSGQHIYTLLRDNNHKDNSVWTNVLLIYTVGKYEDLGFLEKWEKGGKGQDAAIQLDVHNNLEVEKLTIKQCDNWFVPPSWFTEHSSHMLTQTDPLLTKEIHVDRDYVYM